MNIIDMLNKIGPFLSGIGMMLTAAAAWASFLLIHRHTLHRNWVDSFRVLYNEFWKDENIIKVRRMIANDVEYEKVEQILLERLKEKRNLLTPEDNKVIDYIDGFCALLMKIEFFDRNHMTPEQRKLWERTYVTYWISKIKERDALVKYISEYWKDIVLQSPES